MAGVENPYYKARFCKKLSREKTNKTPVYCERCFVKRIIMRNTKNKRVHNICRDKTKQNKKFALMYNNFQLHVN